MSNVEKPPKNVYNSRLRRDQPKLKVWQYAGLMLTYKCPASCRFCYYNCGPEKSGLMSTDIAISTWQSLTELAGSRARIHITGGEPFLYFNRLAEILGQANKLNLAPIDTIETNAFWATDDKIISSRLKILDQAGMRRLKISYDPFHAEFVDVESVQRLVNAATEILGPKRVMVRWKKYLQEPVKNSPSCENYTVENFAAAIKEYPCRFTGRAATQLAGLFAREKPDIIAEQTCKKAFLSAKGIHVDPYGNVFSGLYSGIILAKISEISLKRLWESFDPENNVFFSTLFESGPAGLLEEATRSGYKRRQFYADKCHLCSELRQFFFDMGKYKQIIGPCDCYAQSP